MDFKKLPLLVKAHEKEIYDAGDKVIAKVHHDNHGDYHFSELDFYSHKLLELIYPGKVPIMYEANFDSDPYFIMEKVTLDPLHKAYNVWRQKIHQEEGYDYRYDPSYLDASLDKLEKLCQQHKEKVDAMQEANKNNLNKFGITFDHSHVNITWRKQDFVALEVHKGRKDYLFNYEKCLDYFEHAPDAIRKQGQTYLKAIKGLLDI